MTSNNPFLQLLPTILLQPYACLFMNVLFFSISMKCFRSTNSLQAIICHNGDNGINSDELWLVMEGLQHKRGSDSLIGK